MTAIDLFSGLGGFTEGATQAGCKVIWAANHWHKAVQFHAYNHPETEHSCQDLQQANFYDAPRHDITLASSACQGFSKAKGAEKPGSDAARATAWAIVACSEAHRSKFVLVENVPEFLTWVLFPAWKSAMEILGYSVSPHIVDAADFGVPQNRVRAFVVCTRTKAPLVLKFEPKPHVAVSTILDHGTGWNPIAEKCEKTRAKVEAGRKDLGPRFLIPYYGNSKTGRCLSRPIGTVTTRDRYGLADGDLMRMLTPVEYRRAMGFPENYKLPAEKTLATHLLGNAVCPPVARDVINAIKAA